MIVSLIWHLPNMATPAYDSERHGDKRCTGERCSGVEGLGCALAWVGRPPRWCGLALGFLADETVIVR